VWTFAGEGKKIMLSSSEPKKRRVISLFKIGVAGRGTSFVWQP
jgi:hypothetical protein